MSPALMPEAPIKGTSNRSALIADQVDYSNNRGLIPTATEALSDTVLRRLCAIHALHVCFTAGPIAGLEAGCCLVG